MSKQLIKPKFDLNKSDTHIIPFSFEYFEPRTINEAIELLTKYGSEAKVLAGGTDLLVRMKQGVVRPKYVVNIKRIKELEIIEDRGEYLAIGALTKLRSIEKHTAVQRRFPALYEALKSMAGVQIRNMGTIGGNLCNASPAADTAPPLMVYEAKLKIVGAGKEKQIPINQFFKGPGRTVLEPSELLAEIHVPYVTGKVGSAFIKIARTAMDLAKVNVAVLIKVGEGGVVELARIALGSVAPTPIRAVKAEELLMGKEFTAELAKEAGEVASEEIKPITDIRSTAEYRREITKVIVRDALMLSYDRALGGG